VKVGNKESETAEEYDEKKAAEVAAEK